MLKAIDKYNISTWFIYPMYGFPTELDDYLLNTYIYNNEYDGLIEHLHVVLSIPNTIDMNNNKNYRYNYLVNTIKTNPHFFEYYSNKTNEECYIFEIPDSFNDDYYKVLRGEYSKISDKLKNLIKTRFNFSSIHGILNKSPEFKAQIEKLVGTSVTDDAELWSIINDEKETLN